MSGPTPIVAIPGMLCDRRLFAPLAQRLGPRLLTSPSIADATVEAAAERVLEHAPGRFVALGFSLGGFVALELMRRVSDRLAGLILMNTNARADAPERAAARRGYIEVARAQGMAALIETFWPTYLGTASYARADLKALIVDMACGTSLQAFAAQTEIALSRPDSRGDLAASNLPLLIVYGGEERVCPEEMQIEMKALRPDAVCAAIPDAGHFTPVEQPDPVAAAISLWLVAHGEAP